MAQGKQTPRQKMINLMYLVFIAMLAMNIDQEIIRSYYDSTESLKETRLLTEHKNTEIFEQTLATKALNVPDTYAEPWEQYKELKKRIDALVDHVDGVKKKLLKDSEFNESAVDMNENFAALNNNEAVTDYFFSGGDENKPSPQANELKAKIDDVRNYISQTFRNNAQLAELVARSDKALKTEFPGGKKENNKNWLQYKFYHQPLIAAKSNLEILQNDARNVQSDALAMMLQEKVDASIKFNMYDAIVKAPTDVVMGTDAEATVYLASYSNSNKINIQGVQRQENGKGFINLNTGSLGPKTFSGNITVLMADGKNQTIPYTHTYNVIAGPQEVKWETGALLSPDKMNVVYRGLDNPISGSILGVDNSRLSLSAPGASVSGSSGKWIVKPTTGNTIKLTISGTGPRGATSKTFEFRIKNVPPPQGQIRGKAVNSMPATSIANQNVSAALPDFDFPVSFTVNSFMFKAPGRAAMLVQGSSLSSVEGLTKNLRSGDVVYIFDIKTTPIGLGTQQVKNVSPVVINVQ
ncbi:gliding motility protein GldM [Chryseobacterium sp.]|uniref:type IX secretion system motor protein PorM/GldM n=1 Tax=Chryseobacterium sp. TaxID=1871047 RepID=UPI0011C8AE13|nr:gliding motility protein GldM [Chryseobacterium sp.]TXF75092.1 gliding motility protein GldM [Chryseobacterium sp.]